MMLCEFPKSFQYFEGEGESEDDRVGSMQQLNFSHKGDRGSKQVKNREKSLPVLRLHGIRVAEVIRFLYAFIYKKEFAFPLVRKNMNHFVDLIWERRKELKLCSDRPLK